MDLFSVLRRRRDLSRPKLHYAQGGRGVYPHFACDGPEGQPRSVKLLDVGIAVAVKDVGLLDGRTKVAQLRPPCDSLETASSPAWPLHHPTSRRASCACVPSDYHRRQWGNRNLS